MMLKDMHLHTNYSDGKNSILEMIKCAVDLEYTEICFTDHVRKDTAWIDEYVKELSARQKEFQDRIRIVGGIETKLCNWHGGLDVPKDIFDKDLRIVAAIHRIPNEDGSLFCRRDDDVPKERLRLMWKNTMQGVGKNVQIDCIAHPFNWEKTLCLESENGRVIQRLADEKKNLQIEYNVKYDNQCLPDQMWKTLGSRVVIGSDSHSVEDMILRRKYIESAYTRVFGNDDF